MTCRTLAVHLELGRLNSGLLQIAGDFAFVITSIASGD